MGIFIRTVLWGCTILGVGLSQCVSRAANMTELPLMLSTDQGLVIASQQYVLDSVPDGQAHLSFSFGFETDEVLLPQIFSDSVSVGLVSEDQSAFLLLLSADAGGVTWAPTNPLGVLLDSETISRTPTDSRFGPPVYQSGEAYRVSLSLPEAFSKSGTEVYLDLVDNSNGLRSVGWLDSVSFEGIEDSMSLEVFSARSLLGPFLPEAHAIIDETNRLISVPLAGPQRFFRIESGGASKVTEIQRLGDNWSVDFILLDSEPRVWTGNSVSEVVQRVPLKSLGLGFWEASLKMDQSAGFLKVESQVQDGVVSVNSSGDSLKVLLGRSAIESAVNVNGPYSPIQSFVSVGPTTARVKKSESTQFFRSSSDSSWQIRRLTSDQDEVVIEFAEREQVPVRILESSLPDGVYQPVAGAIRNFNKGTSFIVPEENGIRFFKLMGGDRTIREVWVEGAFIRIRYE